jgi:DNA polymerase-3 subunit beta
MKLSVAKDQLLHGLQAVQNIVGSRTTLPILSNVLLQASEERLDLTATDLDVTISCGVSAGVKKAGAITLPVKKLFSIVRELGATELEMEVDEKNGCKIKGGSSYYRMNGLSAEEFPPVPKFAESRRLILGQDKLKEMLRRTCFAVSTDESRYVLNGIFFSFKEHKFTMVATDGRRLALTDEDVEFGEAAVEFIVPTKAINELNRLLSGTGEAEIRVTENQASFQLKDETSLNTLLVTKLVEGNYPNYRQVIPGESAERVVLPREELLQSLRRVEIMTSEKSNSVKLTFTKNNLAITANTPDVGEARESLAVNYKGRDLAVAFNPAYLMDPLKALEVDEIFLEMTDELSPGVVRINAPFLYVIMPMRMS